MYMFLESLWDSNKILFTYFTSCMTYLLGMAQFKNMCDLHFIFFVRIYFLWFVICDLIIFLVICDSSNSFCVICNQMLLSWFDRMTDEKDLGSDLPVIEKVIAVVDPTLKYESLKHKYVQWAPLYEKVSLCLYSWLNHIYLFQNTNLSGTYKIILPIQYVNVLPASKGTSQSAMTTNICQLAYPTQGCPIGGCDRNHTISFP